jgi:uncharacterized protein (DUF362 family)
VKRLRVLQLAAFLVLGFTMPARSALPPPRPEATPSPSKVWFALDQEALGSAMKPRQEIINRMVDGLICAVTAKPDPSTAWHSLVKPGERIGIRVSTLPGPVGGTHAEVALAVVRGLEAAGIASRDIMVWDRRREDLVAAGYESVPGLNLRWIEKGAGYDPRETVSSPVIGQLVFGDLSFKESRNTLADILGPKAQLSEESHLPVILSREIDKVINIPSLCDSCFTGVHGALAGMTVETLDNWRRFGRAGGFAEGALAEVYADDRIGKKVVLTIMDGLVLQYAGGPFPSPANCVQYGTLLASLDPVAVDATALKLLDEQRLVSRLPKASLDGGHVAEAESRGLGNADEKMIKLLRIGNGRESGALPRPVRASTPQPVPASRP